MDELMQRVRMAMRELPDRQQAAIILRDLEGLAYERIAEVLEVSPAAARLLVHRAREAVRQILLRRWPDSFGP
jgi:RNA polymerase sigma-70 factor (ECF subfamily)